MNILDDILNDKNVNNNLKKVMKGEPMSKMGEFAMELENKCDGTEGLSNDQLKEQMNEGYAEHMGQFVLKKVRLELGYNQQQMADALGYTRQDIISGIENGNRTMSGVAVRCLEYLIQIKDLKEFSEEIRMIGMRNNTVGKDKTILMERIKKIQRSLSRFKK